MVRVLVVSPYPTVRAGLRALLAADGEVEVVGETSAFDLAGMQPLKPRVVLVDDPGSMEALEAFASQAPEVGVVLLGGDPARYRAAWGSAPRGFLTHDATAEELIAAVKAVANGLSVVDPALLPGLLASQPPARVEPGAGEEVLTPRELEVLHLLASGLPNKTIALQLHISEHTAKFHVSSVLAKLGAASRTEAVTTAARRGLLLL